MLTADDGGAQAVIAPRIYPWAEITHVWFANGWLRIPALDVPDRAPGRRRRRPPEGLSRAVSASLLLLHYRLDGRATVRIHTGIGRDTDSDLYQDRRHYVWDNHSATAPLRNEHGRFIDDESWGHHRHGGPHHR